MGDSDEDREEAAAGPALQLASFLFGNVDERGRLEDDVLDPESQRQLAALSKLGLGSLLREMMGEEEPEPKPAPVHR